MKRVFPHFLIFGLLLGTLTGCPFSASKSPAEIREENIGKLTVYMQQRYRRELQTDQFEINYVPVPPDKILISVRYKPTANRNLISTLVDSAKEIIHRKGSEIYQLEQIDVEAELKEIL